MNLMVSVYTCPKSSDLFEKFPLPHYFYVYFPLPLLLISNNHLHSMQVNLELTHFLILYYAPSSSPLNWELNLQQKCSVSFWWITKDNYSFSAFFYPWPFLQLSIFYYSVKPTPSFIVYFYYLNFLLTILPLFQLVLFTSSSLLLTK